MFVCICLYINIYIYKYLKHEFDKGMRELNKYKNFFFFFEGEISG